MLVLVPTCGIEVSTILLGMLSFSHLRLPLMPHVKVDYKGFRLSCQSIIRGIKNPSHDIDGIDENSSLIFGSCDAGKTVYQRDTHFNGIMDSIADTVPYTFFFFFCKWY